MYYKISILILQLLFPYLIFSQSVIGNYKPLVQVKPLISAIEVDNDGSIYIGGDISSVNDQFTGSLVKIKANGTVDYTFNPEITSHHYSDKIWNIAAVGERVFVHTSTSSIVMLDGTGALLDTISDYLVRSMKRVSNEIISYGIDGNSKVLKKYDSLGRLDESFKSLVVAGNDGYYNPMKIAGNHQGQVYLAGKFKKGSVNEWIYRFFRANENGTIDHSFNVGRGIEGYFTSVHDMFEQDDGKLLVVGVFTEFNGSHVTEGIVRLNNNGSLDESFQPDLSSQYSPGYEVVSVRQLEDTKILIAARHYLDEYRIRLIRLNKDGSIDETFSVPSIHGVDPNLLPYIYQASDKLKFVGDQELYNGHESKYVSEIDTQGELIHNDNFTLGQTPEIFNAESNENDRLIVSSNGGVMVIDNSGNLDITTMNNLYSVGNRGSLVPYDVQYLSNGQFLVGGPNDVSKHNSDGTKDGSFKISGVNLGSVYDIHYAFDDEIFLTGTFDYSINNMLNYDILKVNSSGKIDTNFLSGQATGERQLITSFKSIQSEYVYGIKDFGVNKNFVKKINHDGNPNNSFNEIVLENSNIDFLEVLYDSLILTHGEIYTAHSNNDPNPIRIWNKNGTLLSDTTLIFNGFSKIESLTPINDSIFIVSGYFDSVNGLAYNNIAIIDMKGNVYNSHLPQTDGKISDVIRLGKDTLIYAGNFSIVDGVKRTGFAAVANLIPNTPTNTTLAQNSESPVSLVWEYSNHADFFQVERSLGSTNDFMLVGKTKSASFEDDNVNNYTNYVYRVKAINVFGESDFSLPYEVFVENVVLTMANGHYDEINIYPNPSSNGSFYIEVDNIIDIEAYTITGQSKSINMRKEGFVYHIELLNNSGLFLVKVITNQGTYVKQLIVR